MRSGYKVSLAWLHSLAAGSWISCVSLKTGFLLLAIPIVHSGDEQGMIEDMDAAVLFLRDVTMKMLRSVMTTNTVEK